MERVCEICGGSEHKLLHRQGFEVIGQSAPLHYDVVCCDACAFIFASNVPDQQTLAEYYRDNAKHVYGATLPAGLERIHHSLYEFIRKHFLEGRDKASMSILEAGCSGGHFLNRLQTHGYKDVQGVEPSELGARAAKEHFGLNVENTTLDRYTPNKTFDLIIMSGVLEHIASLNDAVRSLSSLLSDNGCVAWLVPDAGQFDKIDVHEPFFEFALEHINFFSKQSLGRLAAKHGLHEQTTESPHNDFYNNYNLLGLYQKRARSEVQAIIDDKTRANVEAYIKTSRAKLVAIDGLLRPHLASPLAVWGTGMFSSRLLCDTLLRDAEVSHFVDSSTHVQGRKLRGTTIQAPASLRGQNMPVLVASLVYEEEIKRVLLDELAYEGPIITMSGALDDD